MDLNSNFLKAVFHKFYLVHSWILYLIYGFTFSAKWWGSPKTIQITNKIVYMYIVFCFLVILLQRELQKSWWTVPDPMGIKWVLLLYFQANITMLHFQLTHSVPFSPRDLWKVSETSTMEGFAKTVYGF